MTSEDSKRTLAEKDPYGHELEIRRRREEWKRQRQQEAEERERQAKQAALEAYLQRRAKEWLDTTGSHPPQHVLEDWQRAYADMQEAEYQRQRREKLAEIEREHYSRYSF